MLYNLFTYILHNIRKLAYSSVNVWVFISTHVRIKSRDHQTMFTVGRLVLFLSLPSALLALVPGAVIDVYVAGYFILSYSPSFIIVHEWAELKFVSLNFCSSNATNGMEHVVYGRIVS